MISLLKIWVLVNMLVFAIAVSHAQEQSTPREQALMQRVSGEINGNLVCSANVIALQDKIKELEAKLKATEKPEDPK